MACTACTLSATVTHCFHCMRNISCWQTMHARIRGIGCIHPVHGKAYVKHCRRGSVVATHAIYQLMSDASCGMSCHNVALSQRLCQTVAHCMRGISWCHTMHAQCKSHQLMSATACAGSQLLSDTTCTVSVLGTHMHARYQLLSGIVFAVHARHQLFG